MCYIPSIYLYCTAILIANRALNLFLLLVERFWFQQIPHYIMTGNASAFPTTPPIDTIIYSCLYVFCSALYAPYEIKRSCYTKKSLKKITSCKSKVFKAEHAEHRLALWVPNGQNDWPPVGFQWEGRHSESEVPLAQKAHRNSGSIY